MVGEHSPIVNLMMASMAETAAMAVIDKQTIGVMH